MFFQTFGSIFLLFLKIYHSAGLKFDIAFQVIELENFGEEEMVGLSDILKSLTFNHIKKRDPILGIQFA